MRTSTRRERHDEMLKAFLEDDSRETMQLCLYNREIPQIPLDFPDLSVKKISKFKGDLWNCLISKI